jgi:hypothetical protein
VPALCSSKVLALYFFSGLIKVFTDARGACNYIAIRCQLLYSFSRSVKVFIDAKGAVSL